MRSIQLSKKSLTRTLGVLLVFAVPLVFLYGTLKGDVAAPESTGTRQLHSKSEVVDKQLTFETSVFDEPVISVVFDDGWESVYSNALPILEKYGIDSTQFVLSGTFDDEQYVSRQQVLDMIRYGHEIASHTVTHPDLTMLSDEELVSELYNSRLDLESLTGKPVEDIAVPFGSTNEHTAEYVKKWYRSLRTVNTGVNTLDTFDVFALNSPTITSSYTNADILRLVAEARATNGWLILNYHQIDASATEYAVTPATFNKHMQLLVDSGVDILTYGAVLDTIKSQGAQQ